MRQASLHARRRIQRRRTIVVGIVGGSGSGKSWLADKLMRALAPNAVRLSLDDYYRDRSHLSLLRRARLNFDHPSAIDWHELERVVRALLRARPTHIVSYDFKTHSRLPSSKTLKPKRVVLLDGLWLFRRPAIRALLNLRVFLDCSKSIRFRRRLARDVRARGRTQASVQKQFQATVEPMHQRFVEPQRRYADLILPGTCAMSEVRALAARIKRVVRASHRVSDT
jgi:uridine kinase